MFSSTDSGGSWPGPASVFDIRESLMELNPRLARWAEEGWVGALFLFRKKCPSPRPTPPNEKLVGGVGGKNYAVASAALLLAIRCISSVHESTNAFAPSTCSLCASASTSTPACA